MKQLIVIGVAMCLPLLGVTQIQELEILPTTENFDRFIKVPPTKENVDSLIALTIAYNYVDEDSSILLGERALSLSIDNNLPENEVEALRALGDGARLFGKIKRSDEYLHAALEKALHLENAGLQAKTYNSLGILETTKGEYQTSMQHYIKTLELLEIEKDSMAMIKPYLNISWICYRLQRTHKARFYLGEAARWAEMMNDEETLVHIYNNQGILYRYGAEDFKDRADTIPEKADVLLDSMHLFIEKSLERYNASLALAKKNGKTSALIGTLGNMVDLNIWREQYAEALKSNKEIEALALKAGAPRGISQVYLNMARIYNGLGQYQNARKYGEANVALVDTLNMTKELSMAHKHLYHTYEKLGDIKNTHKYYKLYNEYQIEETLKENTQAVEEMEIQYQTAEKDKKILNQKFELLELEKQKARRDNFIVSGVLLTLLTFLAMWIKRIRKERNDKRAFAEALIFAQEEERKRIARDLHDGVGQSLLLIRKQMEKAQATTLENQHMITATLEEVRSISRDLHPMQLEKFGLTATLVDLMDKLGDDLFVTREIDDVDEIFSPKAEINIYRTVQEALSNIVKHANATAAKLSVTKTDQDVIITIQDNGQGFDHATAVKKSKSLGLRTMKERIQSLDGNLKIEKGSPSGTVVSISIPIEQN